MYESELGCYSGKNKAIQTKWRRIKKNKSIYMLITPVIVCFIIFNYVPMLGVLMAFNNYKMGLGFSGIFMSPWVGFEHFLRLFSNPYIYIVLRNTIWISLLKLFFCFPAPILFALLLNEIRGTKFKRSVQTITYLPHFLSAVVVMGLVQGLFSPSYGMVNAIRNAFGMNTVHYLAKTEYFRSIIVGIDLWKGFGWGAIVYLAAITSIDSELYESATIDGAGRLQKTIYITIPGIFHIIALYLILNVGNILNAGFEMIFLLQSPTVMSVADIIDIYTYRLGLQEANYSFGTAVGLFKSVVSLILVSITNMLAKKMGTPGIW